MREIRVAIIGAGLGGIATAVKLKRSGVQTFQVFERDEGPGGVWWRNTYPGCEVDVPSLVYSYSFVNYTWPSRYASQVEVQRYVEHVIDRFQIRDRFRFRTAVSAVRWSDEEHQYTVELSTGEVEHFDVVVSCLGMFSSPNRPEWPGMDTFHGPVFHTSEFRHDIDLTGKRVAIIGTGSTACQLAPALAGTVGALDVYQREPGYVLPKRGGRLLPDEWARYDRIPLLATLRRLALFREAAASYRAFDTRSRAQTKMRLFATSYLQRHVTSPELRRALTPLYPYGCKRPVFAAKYYEMFARDNVNLVPSAVTGFTRNGLIDAAGVERPADVVVLATGFHTTRYQSTLHVVGSGGRVLHEQWNGEPQAFLGMSVPGFPNFFMLYGPNTNGGWSIISTLERQAEAVVNAVRKLRKHHNTTLDTRPAVSNHYNTWLQRRLRNNASETGCHNYYHSETGRNVTQLPMTAFSYLLATRLLPPVGWRTATATGRMSETRASDPGLRSAVTSGTAVRSAVTPIQILHRVFRGGRARC